MKHLLVALVVAGLVVVGSGASAASAQTIVNPPGVGPGNPAGTGVSVATPGAGALGNPYGYGPYGYGASSFYGGRYGASGFGLLPYFLYGGYSGYTYLSYYGIDSPSPFNSGPESNYFGVGGAGAAQWHCMPVGSTIAVPVGPTQPTEGYTGCSYHP